MGTHTPSAFAGKKIRVAHVARSISGFRIRSNPRSSRDPDQIGFVSAISYTNNVLTGISTYGVLVDQSYPQVFGDPTGGGVTYSVSATLSVADDSDSFTL